MTLAFVFCEGPDVFLPMAAVNVYFDPFCNSLWLQLAADCFWRSPTTENFSLCRLPDLWWQLSLCVALFGFRSCWCDYFNEYSNPRNSSSRDWSVTWDCDGKAWSDLVQTSTLNLQADHQLSWTGQSSCWLVIESILAFHTRHVHPFSLLFTCAILRIAYTWFTTRTWW